MPSIGHGVYELRIRNKLQYLIFYVTKYRDAIYVLHTFVKKTQKTNQKDLKVGIERYKALLKVRHDYE